MGSYYYILYMDKISSTYLEIYVIDGCPYCAATKELVKQRGIPTKMYRVSTAEKAKYKALHGMNTFPHVFLVKGGRKTKIGGYEDLLRWGL